MERECRMRKHIYSSLKYFADLCMGKCASHQMGFRIKFLQSQQLGLSLNCLMKSSNSPFLSSHVLCWKTTRTTETADTTKTTTTKMTTTNDHCHDINQDQCNFERSTLCFRGRFNGSPEPGRISHFTQLISVHIFSSGMDQNIFLNNPM